ncbi:hypothetical protein HOC13_01840 [Candidatus Woesearchaeota archaeon]|jgi:hypothetical protein|nr:hypothetical protein [Candidatus Woesearchaeota archaeon]
MLISFFEEFPTKENLSKLNLVNFSTKLYVAATSLKEFEKIVNSVSNKYVKEFIYWPLLSKKEGYWISPFSNRKGLLRILEELGENKVSVMLDLELPTRHNFWLYFTQLFNFSKNKKLVGEFIEKYKGDVYLAEYYPEGIRKEKIMRYLGLHFSNEKVKVIKMIYHSLHNFKEEFIRKELQRGREELGDRFLVALGTIAKGVGGNEPLLEAKQLDDDLQMAEEIKVKEVIMFRLGGLTKEYVSVLKAFSK